MKIENKTDYDTRYLRRVFMACEKHEGTNPKHRFVRVTYNTTCRIRGSAWIGCHSLTMTMPKPRKDGLVRDGIMIDGEIVDRYGANVHNLARVYIHEVDHNLGLRHKDMSEWWNIDVSWLPENELIPMKVKAPKAKRNIVEVRAENAQKKLDEWTKKLNRAKTGVKKYRRKVRYYERKTAANK